MALKPKRSEPKAKGTSRASKPRKSTAEAKSLPKAAAKAKPCAEAEHASAMAAYQLVDERIRVLGGWRAETLQAVRRLIHQADPNIMEECKWIKTSNPLGVPTWSHAGIVCTGEAYKQVVKLTFARGASLADPRGLFNSSLDGNTRRAIDIREGEALDAEAFEALIRAAVAQNLRSSGPKSEGRGQAQEQAIESSTDGGRPVKRKTKATTHDEYLAGLPHDKRTALERLRRTIQAAAPGAEECMSYELPAFRLGGKVLVLFGATAKQCSFYPGSGTAVEAYQGDLKGYGTSKGTIRFDADKPLPATLVLKIVKYRIAENATQQQHAADGAARRR